MSPFVEPLERMRMPLDLGLGRMAPGSKLRSWVTELRAPFLTASTLPVLVGSAVAWASSGVILWDYLLLSLAAGVSLHLAANVANDYFDHRSGNDELNVEFIRPFSGGSRVIQRGLLKPSEVLLGSLVFLGLGMSIGIYLAWMRGLILLLLGAVMVFSACFYTGPPIDLAKRGVGELTVGLNFGVLAVLGASYVQTRALGWEPMAAGIPLGALIAAVLYVNEFPDYQADRAVGKRTLVVRLGRKRAVLGYGALLASAYLSIVVSAAVGLMSPFTLLGLLTLPLALKAYGCARSHHAEPRQLVPANALTVAIHLATGLLIALGYVLQGLLSRGLITW